MKKLVIVLTGTAALLAPAQAALPRVAANTVEPTARLSKGGTAAEVRVLLGCDIIQRAALRVSVTQSPEAAFAQAKRSVPCTTTTTAFPVDAQLRRHNRLVPGDATVCVLALTADDARQWCKDITLVG